MTTAEEDHGKPPLTQRLLNSDEGQEHIGHYLNLAEDKTEEDMESMLERCIGNHFWTTSEKTCLCYYVDKWGQDFKKLKQDYFSHRSEVALKSQYKKILRGEDTPATTPRLSISNISKQTSNSLIKLLTPKSTPMKKSAEKILMDDDEVDHLLLDDDILDDNVEMEEEDVEMEEEEEEEIPEEVVEEQEEVEPETTPEEEQEETEVEEAQALKPAVEDKSNQMILWGILIPLCLVVLFVIVIINCPDDALGPQHSELLQFKQNILDMAKDLKKDLENWM